MRLFEDSDLRPFVQLRRDIHAHPELAFEEHRTSQLVAERLRAYGYTVTEGIGGTGVLGQMQRGQGKRLGLRADMDALPIQEASQMDWASRTPGRMHACGHDGHTATLLAAAERLAKNKNWQGSLNLIFQPAEEGGGGALRMMDDGLFEKAPCDAIFAFHNMPGFPAGQLLFREGPAMASSDYLTVRLHGVGGHGALPHHTQDPVVTAASVIMALQTVVARNVDPLKPAVVTVGAVHAGEANNVIPHEARLEISLRALDPEVRKDMRRLVDRLVHQQAESFGLRADCQWREGYAVLVNSPAETQFACSVARDTFGDDRVVAQGPMLMGSEDFSFMLQRLPGCYLLIGNGNETGAHGCMVHNPGYDFNDAIIETGATFWVRLTERFLPHPQ